MEGTIAAYIAKYTEHQQSYSEGSLENNLYEPVKYIMQLPAKHLRPAAVLMAADAFNKGINADSYNIATAIEIFHNFTLMHDDIMDKASMRRGQESTHKKFGTNKAILSGDAMLLLSYRKLMTLKDPLKEDILPFFTEIGLKICEGQSYDMLYETRKEVAETEYIEMIRLKTSVLFGAGLYMGALSGGATEEDSNALYSFGEKIGIAFQIQDDYLDVFGEDKKVGKMWAGDIYRQKKTLLFIKLLEKAEEKDKAKILKIYEPKHKVVEEEVSTILGLMKKYGVEQEIKRSIISYYNNAVTNLDNLSISEENHQNFRKFADTIIQRDK